MFCAGISTRFPLPSYPYKQVSQCRVTSICWENSLDSSASGLPRWRSRKESACQCGRHRRCRFDPGDGKIPWRRRWQPTTVFSSGKSHGQRSLAGYSPWDHKVGHSLAPKQQQQKYVTLTKTDILGSHATCIMQVLLLPSFT